MLNPNLTVRIKMNTIIIKATQINNPELAAEFVAKIGDSICMLVERNCITLQPVPEFNSLKAVRKSGISEDLFDAFRDVAIRTAEATYPNGI